MESEPESTRAILDNAWGHIPQTRETTAGLGSFTRLRIERIISIVVGLGSLVLGTQAFLNALAPYQESPQWHVPLMAMTFVPLGAMLVACAVGRGVRLFAGIFAVLKISFGV